MLHKYYGKNNLKTCLFKFYNKYTVFLILTKCTKIILKIPQGQI